MSLNRNELNSSVSSLLLKQYIVYKINSVLLRHLNNLLIGSLFYPMLLNQTVNSRSADLQLFCYSELELSNKGNLYYISNANVKNNFYNIRLSVEKLSLATYVNEICANVSEFLEGDNEYFRFVLNTLYFIEHAEGETETNELKKLKAIFELRSASFAGFMPSFLNCVNCGCEKNLAFFDVMGGGAVCADCKSQNAIGVNEYLLKTMQFLCCAPLKTVFSTPIKNEDALDVINTISERYISEKLEYYFKSLDYYNNIMKKTM